MSTGHQEKEKEEKIQGETGTQEPAVKPGKSDENEATAAAAAVNSVKTGVSDQISTQEPEVKPVSQMKMKQQQQIRSIRSSGTEAPAVNQLYQIKLKMKQQQQIQVN